MKKFELIATSKNVYEGYAYYVILDRVWGYSVGNLKVSLADGSATIYCASRRNVRFEMPITEYANVQHALATFRFEYEAALQKAHDNGQKCLEARRAEGLPELTGVNLYGNDEIVCVMSVGMSDEWLDTHVDVDCTPQEALALINSQTVMGTCVGSSHGSITGGKGFLQWYSYRGALTIHIGCYKGSPIATCKNADWRWKDR